MAERSGPIGPTMVSCIQGDVRQLHAARDTAGRCSRWRRSSTCWRCRPEVTPEHGVTAISDPRKVRLAPSPRARPRSTATTGGRGWPKGQTPAARRLPATWAVLGNEQTRSGPCATATPCARAKASPPWTAGSPRLRPSSLTDCETLRIGLQRDVEVTDPAEQGQVVTQAYCSALPVAYSGLPWRLWKRFACLVLEAAYEATLLAGVLNAREGGSPIVMLTRLGGGALGNDTAWIHGAMRHAMARVQGCALDVRIVSYGPVPDGSASLRPHSTGRTGATRLMARACHGGVAAHHS